MSRAVPNITSRINNSAKPLHDSPNTPYFRRFRKGVQALKRSGTPLDIMCIGDSITTGYNSTTAYGNSWVENLQLELKKIGGYPTGGVGYRPATTLGYNTPRFTTSVGSPSLNGIGFGLNGTYLPYGAEVTITTTCDRILLNYQRYNASTLSYLEVVDSIDGVLTGAGLDANDGATAFPGRCNTVWDSGALTSPSQSRTITIRCKTDAVKQSGATFVNAFFLNKEGAGDIRVWNGGKFAATTANYLFNLDTDLIGNQNSSGLNAPIVCIALGINETSPTTYYTNLVALANQIIAQQTTNIPPSFVFWTPWPKTGRAAAANAPYEEACKAAARQVGAAVFDAAAIIGDGSLDYIDLLDTDGIHPTDAGHRVLAQAFAHYLAEAGGLQSGQTWVANNGGSKLGNHIAIGEGSVDTTPPMTGLAGTTTSAGVINHHTFTDSTAGQVTEAAILNTASINANGNSGINYICQDGLVQVASGNSKNYTGLIAGDGGAVYHYGSGTVSLANGVFGLVENLSSGTLTKAEVLRSVTIPGGTSTTTDNYGLTSQVLLGVFGGTPTITNNHDLHVYDSTVFAGTLTNNYGIYVEPKSSGGTSRVGARFDAPTSGASTNNMTLWLSGNADLTVERGGIVFGASKDTNLYRQAANTLETDDSLRLGVSSGAATSKLSINNASLGSNALDVFTATAGELATFQHNGAVNGGTIVNYILGNAVTGSVYGAKVSGSTTSNLYYTIQQNGNGNAVNDMLVLGTGDAFSQYGINGGQYWVSGLDNSDSDSYVISSGATLGTNNVLRIDTSFNITTYGDVTMSDAKNIVLNTTTGTKIGTSTSQKLAFYNATPVVQQTNDVNALVTYGLLSSLSNMTLTKEVAATILISDSTTNNTAGAALSITSGKGKGSAAGGALNLTAGASDTAGVGGAVKITAGLGTNLSKGGNVELLSGAGFNGGDVKIDVGGGFAGAKILIGTVRGVPTGFNVTSPTAYIHIAGSSTTAGTAPLKFSSGTNMTTAETGAVEYNGTNLFFTRTGTTRETVFTGTSGATAPTTTATPTFTNYYGGNTNALGDPNSWASVNINGTTYKIPLYT